MARDYVPYVKTYNAKDTTIVITKAGGVATYITGLGEDMWGFEKAEDLAEDTVGAMGDVCRNEINNPIYNATVTVQRTSPQYNFLRSLAKETEPFSIWMTNKALGIKEGGSKALCTSVPASNLGASAEDAEFGFTVYDGVSVEE